MHSEILDAPRIALLRELAGLPELKDFYLAGGTALSLQLGLRVSVDFDFFTANRFNAPALEASISSRFPHTQVIHLDPDTCDLMTEGVQVSLFRYPYPLCRPLVRGDEPLDHLRLASVEDIAVMKLAAIGSRGSRKDFYDLYEIFALCPSVQPERLLSLVRQKFGPQFDLTYMLMGLTYFEDAESEVMPRLFVQADWETVKNYFYHIQKEMFTLEEQTYKAHIRHP